MIDVYTLYNQYNSNSRLDSVYQMMVHIRVPPDLKMLLDAAKPH